MEGLVRGAAAFEIEHASTSCWEPSDIEEDCGFRSRGRDAIVGQ
jgi:hypothetical protein